MTGKIERIRKLLEGFRCQGVLVFVGVQQPRDLPVHGGAIVPCKVLCVQKPLIAVEYLIGDERLVIGRAPAAKLLSLQVPDCQVPGERIYAVLETEQLSFPRSHLAHHLLFSGLQHFFLDARVFFLDLAPSCAYFVLLPNLFVIPALLAPLFREPRRVGLPKMSLMALKLQSGKGEHICTAPAMLCGVVFGPFEDLFALPTSGFVEKHLVALPHVPQRALVGERLPGVFAVGGEALPAAPLGEGFGLGQGGSRLWGKVEVGVFLTEGGVVRVKMYTADFRPLEIPRGRILTVGGTSPLRKKIIHIYYQSNQIRSLGLGGSVEIIRGIRTSCSHGGEAGGWAWEIQLVGQYIDCPLLCGKCLIGFGKDQQHSWKQMNDSMQETMYNQGWEQLQLAYLAKQYNSQDVDMKQAPDPIQVRLYYYKSL